MEEKTGPELEKLRELVVFDKVTKAFGDGPHAKVAIKEVSFVVEDLPNRGELIAIVGQSGCGKSTVLRILAGLEPHFPPTRDKPGADRGMVDQKYSLMPHLTVLDNIAFGLKLRGVAARERRDRAREWAKKVGLEGAEDKYPSELSGGMQQRVSIAATLILAPKILLMDEPFGALDPKTRMQMQELLVQLWQEQQSTVFIVTHSVEEAIYLGDRVFRMATQPGRLVEILELPRPDMPPEVMRKKPWFNELTQELLRRLETDAPASGELPGIEKWRGQR
ncbi:MAG: ABC transporter ATP-binding protein [Verrucomicrobia bacterium]|nr:MAG: ABC transporter ATP-binding protein [Verrucomicrobiota bacterium]